MTIRAPLRVLSAALLTLAACGPQDVPADSTVGSPLPDTFPVTGTVSDLPEGMPLPPEGRPLPPESTPLAPDAGPTTPQPF
jgi:hypothetical protein